MSLRVELASDSAAVDSVAVDSVAVDSVAVDSAAADSVAVCSIAVDSIATLLPQQKLSSLTERRRAQMLRRKTRLMEGEARDEGASAELSDMQRRGSSDAR